MSGEIEAAGALAAAGLAAKALEPASGAAGVQGSACLNCGAALASKFCPDCGQPAKIHRSIGHAFEEFLHGVVHFDGKAWRTLPLLAFKPGRLTYDYIHGKRARYVSPLAMFLFSIFLMFFVFSFMGAAQVKLKQPPVVERLTAAREMLAEAKAAREDSQSQAELSRAVKAEEAAQALIRRLEAEARGQAGETSVRDELGAAISSGALNVNVNDPALNERIRHALSNPDLVFYKVQQKAYKLSFLLIPLSLPFLWLLFAWRRDITLYDHTVFSLYSISFMSILFVLMAMLSRSGAWGDNLSGLLFLAIPAHMFAHVKGTYALSWFSAFWRTIALTVMAAAVLGIFMIIMVLLGLFD